MTSSRLPAEALKLLRLTAQVLPGPCHLVGGALRDVLLGRPFQDIDLALPGARAGAASLAKKLHATCIALDQEEGTYRLILPKEWSLIRQIDLSEIQGPDILTDLHRRDFTANALALPVTQDMPAAVAVGDILDPRDGLGDLRRGLLRCEKEEIFKADPLRLLRAFRLASQLGWKIEPGTLKRIRGLRSRVRRSAPERISAELTMLLSAPGCSRWVRLMEKAGLLTVLFDDLESSRQCAQCYYGPGGVLEHTLTAVDRLDFLFENLDGAFGPAADPLREALGERLRPGHPWRAVLMLAVLLHDVSTPETARRLQGRLRFFGHEEAGAQRAAAILKALRFPNAAVRTVAAVVAQHMRPGHLAAGGPVTDKAVYRYFRDLDSEALAALLACWADHASYLPTGQLVRLLPKASADPDSDAANIRPVLARKTLRHLQIISYLLRRRFDPQKQAVPERILNGHAVMKALGLGPGPRVGEVLEKLREAQAEGKVATRQEALSFIQSLKRQD